MLPYREGGGLPLVGGVGSLMTNSAGSVTSQSIQICDGFWIIQVHLIFKQAMAGLPYIKGAQMWDFPSLGFSWFWCNVSLSPTNVSPTENSWMLHPLDKVSLGCFAPWPNHPIPKFRFAWANTRLPTAARFSAAKRWISMCGPSVHPTEGRQSNKPGQGHRRSRPDAPLIHYRCRRPTGPGSGHISQGHNIQGTLCSRGATSKNFWSWTHRSGTHQPCILIFTP